MAAAAAQSWLRDLAAREMAQPRLGCSRLLYASPRASRIKDVSCAQRRILKDAPQHAESPPHPPFFLLA
jgi:hypothetical protein